jgi:predicted transcriptional regulator
MKKSIFYSWQSDSNQKENRFLIKDTLEEAVRTLSQGFTIDEATREIPGHAPIFDSIMRKIRTAALFVADLTLVGQYSETKGTPNPNVLIEYGYALAVMGDLKIIPIMNISAGRPDALPFDLRHRSVRVQYQLEPNADGEKRKNEGKRLTEMLRREITLVWKKVLSGGLTDQELRIVELFVRQSELGRPGTPQLTREQLQQALNLDAAEVGRAIDKLEGEHLIKRLAVLGPTGGSISPTLQLFLDFDAFFMEWDPAQDARTIAEELVSNPHPEPHQLSAHEIAERYKWTPRRLNPALQYLVVRNLVGKSNEHHLQHAFRWIWEIPETRRFVRGFAEE